MNARLGSFALLTLWAITGSVWAQSRPDQPVEPQLPTLQARPAQPSLQMQQPAQAPAQPPVPKPPFTLTPQEEAQVDTILKQWEDHNKTIKTFDCRFKRWVYDAIFGQPNQAKFLELGILQYAAPDRGKFQVTQAEENGRGVEITPARAEHWIADGKSIFEYQHAQKQLIEHQLPPQLQGKAISDSPLPFLFGSEAQKLKQRYWIKQLAPPQGFEKQIWLQAWPKFQHEAANFLFAEFAIETKNKSMIPYGLKLVQPNGKDSVTYLFYEVVVNDPIRFFKGDPFRASTPGGWKKIVQQAAPTQPQAQPEAQARQPANEQR